MNENNCIDFSIVYDRKNTNSIKWHDVYKNAIPMWIADMDFKCPQEILLELESMISHGIIGYPFISEKYFDSVSFWFKKYHGIDIDHEHIIPVSGMNQALKAIIEEFSSENDCIIIQPPTYYRFNDIILMSKRKILENPLIYCDINHQYQINFNQLEDIAKLKPKIFIFCSPHNPIGKIWPLSDMLKIAYFCKKNDILLVSDEAHGDLIFPGENFTSYAALPLDLIQHSIILTSPAKTFNFSGLRGGNAFVFNKKIKNKFSNRLMRYGSQIVNSFYISATEVGYRNCKNWLDQVLIYIKENYLYVSKFIDENIPKLKICHSNSTYLMWINYSELCILECDFLKLLNNKIVIIEGSKFGGKSDTFFRLNIAAPLDTIKNSMKILEKLVNKI